MVRSAAAVSSRRRLLFWSVSVPAFLFASSRGFGTPIFIIAVLAGLWVLGTREKWSGSEGEANRSAYSVFNEGGRAIAGGPTADRLDAQLRGGVGAMPRTNEDDGLGGGSVGSGIGSGVGGGGRSAAKAPPGATDAGFEEASVRRRKAAEAATRRMKDG